jgi:hypothetical protein
MEKKAYRNFWTHLTSILIIFFFIEIRFSILTAYPLFKIYSQTNIIILGISGLYLIAALVVCLLYPLFNYGPNGIHYKGRDYYWMNIKDLTLKKIRKVRFKIKIDFYDGESVIFDKYSIKNFKKVVQSILPYLSREKIDPGIYEHFDLTEPQGDEAYASILVTHNEDDVANIKEILERQRIQFKFFADDDGFRLGVRKGDLSQTDELLKDFKLQFNPVVLHCPQCHSEYRAGSKECIDCHVPLVRGVIEDASKTGDALMINENDEDNVEILAISNAADVAFIKSIMEGSGIAYQFFDEQYLAKLMVRKEDEQEVRELLKDIKLHYEGMGDKNPGL